MNRQTNRVILWLALAGILFLWWMAQGGAPPWFQSLQSEGAAPPAAEDHEGPHGGRVFTQNGLQAELALLEESEPPEFRLWVWYQGRPVSPGEVRARVTLERLGGFKETFEFKPENDHLSGNGGVKEPHSFDVTLQVQHGGQKASWTFSQVEMRATIDPEMAQEAGIETERAGPARLKSTLTLVGEIGLHERRLAHVVPRVNGVVREVYKYLGDQVRKGDLLALMESRELADAKSALLDALKKAEPVFLDLEREETLHENIGKMLKLLDQKPDLETLDGQLKPMLLGEARALIVPAYAKFLHLSLVYQREKELYAKKISSESDFLLAREQFESARARFHTLREKIEFDSHLTLLNKRHLAEKAELAVLTAEQKLAALGLSDEEIRRFYEREDEEEQRFTEYPLKSPINGEIIEKHLTRGEAVKGVDTVLVIADLSKLWVNIAVPARNLGTVSLGQTVRLREDNLGLEATGRLTYLGSVIDATTRTVTGRVVIDNPKRLWKPRMFVTVELVRGERKVPLAVRVDALQKLRDQDVVFVKYGDQYQARPVEVGEKDRVWAEIKEGLRPGEEYVAKNSFAIKAEIGKSTASHQH